MPKKDESDWSDYDQSDAPPTPYFFHWLTDLDLPRSQDPLFTWADVAISLIDLVALILIYKSLS